MYEGVNSTKWKKPLSRMQIKQISLHSQTIIKGMVSNV
jgi:hypothetical protein